MLKSLSILIASLVLSQQALAGKFVRQQVKEVSNVHNIENGLEIEISEKGFSYLTEHLDRIGSALGFNLKNNQLDSIGKKLPPISLSEFAKNNQTAAAMLQTLNKVTNLLIGLQIKDPAFEFDAEDIAYNVNYSKIQLVPMPALIGENSRDNGAVGFALKVVIDSFNLSAGTSVLSDKNNPVVGPIEMQGAEVKLISPSIFFTLPFIIQSKGDSTFEVTVSKGHTNLDNIDIHFGHKKILRPVTTVSIDHNCSQMSALAQSKCESGFQYMVNNDQLIADIEAQLPKLMEFAQNYISEVTESKLTELLSDKEGNSFNKSITTPPIVEYMPIDPLGKSKSKEEDYYNSNIDAFKLGDRRDKGLINFDELNNTCLSKNIFFENGELGQQVAFISQETLFDCLDIDALNSNERSFWKSSKLNYIDTLTRASLHTDDDSGLIDTKIALNAIGDSSLGFNLKANHFSSGTTSGLNLGFDISIEDNNSAYGASLLSTGQQSVLRKNYSQKTDFAKLAPKNINNDYDFEVAVAINSKVINSLITKSFERGYFNQMDSTKTSEQVWRHKECRVKAAGGRSEKIKTEESSLIMSRAPVIVTSVSELNSDAINNPNSPFWQADKFKNIKKIFKGQQLNAEELFLKMNVQVAHEQKGFLENTFLKGDVTYIELDLILLVKKIQGTGQLGLFMVDFDPDSIKVVNKTKFKKKIRKTVEDTMECALDEWINHPTAETSSEYGMALVPVIPLDRKVKGVGLVPKKLTVDENGNLIMYSDFNREESITTETY